MAEVVVSPAGHGSDTPDRDNRIARPIGDDELWQILGWRPTSPQERGRILFPWSAGLPGGLSSEPDNSPTPVWITWAKGEIQNVDADRSLYLCRLVRLLQVFHRDDVTRTPGVEKAFLATAFASGLAIARLDLEETPDWQWILAAAESRQFLLTERVDEWRPGMPSGSGWKRYIRLTVAGRRWVESHDRVPPPSWTSSPSEPRMEGAATERSGVDAPGPLSTVESDNQSAETTPEADDLAPCPSAILFFRNEDRDRWIYEECCRGTAYKSIVSALRPRAVSDGWEPIDTEQGILRAARNYAERKHLPEPPARKRGRPRQAEN